MWLWSIECLLPKLSWRRNRPFHSLVLALAAQSDRAFSRECVSFWHLAGGLSPLLLGSEVVLGIDMSSQWLGTIIRSFERSIWRLATFSYIKSHLHSGHWLLFWSYLEGKNWKRLHLDQTPKTLLEHLIKTLLAHCRRIARSRFHWGWSRFASQLVALSMVWSDHRDIPLIFLGLLERTLAASHEAFPHWYKHRELFPFVVGFYLDFIHLFLVFELIFYRISDWIQLMILRFLRSLLVRINL